MTPEIRMSKGYVPGSLGRVIELHGTYYHTHWGFGTFFEVKVAAELAAFFSRYNEDRDGFWTAAAAGRIEGAITIDGMDAHSKGAHLRWFIVSDALRGKGVGNRLIDAAMGFCRRKGYRTVYLWTFGGLDAARHLYEKAGFLPVESHTGKQWGTEVNEQRLICHLGESG
jgi:GNAT superfamily N-acetyltransferase